MEERLRSLNGITFREWQKIKTVVSNKFDDTKYENTLTVDENVLNELKAIM